MLKKYSTVEGLAKHPFAQSVLHNGGRVAESLHAPGSLFKVDAAYSREPTQAEFYCVSTGNSLAQLLSVCQQLEHSILYLSSFSPTEKMKQSGISRQSHLLYCIENYIVRSQSVYDRVLRLVDKVFCLYNPSHLISRELVISNTHVKNSEVPPKLKSIRSVIKDYYRDRNEIIHESHYLEDDLRRLEGYTILSAEEPFKNDKDIRLGIKHLTKQIVQDKTRTFSKVNNEAFMAISELFNALTNKYNDQLKILEAIYGRIKALALSGESR